MYGNPLLSVTSFIVDLGNLSELKGHVSCKDALKEREVDTYTLPSCELNGKTEHEKYYLNVFVILYVFNGVKLL